MAEPAENIDQNNVAESIKEKQRDMHVRGKHPISISADNQNTSAIIPQGDALKSNITTGDAGGEAANNDQKLKFDPKIGYERKGKEPFLNKIGFHVDTSALGTFYGLFRLTGYIAQGGYNWSEKRLGQGAIKADWYTKLFNANSKKFLNTVETVGFTSLATTFAGIELKEEFKDCSLAVAAEKGKNPRAISFMDLRHSRNPIVQSEMDRYLWQNSMRIGAGVSFAHHLLTGIVANSLVTTFERTIFYRPIAYDILKKAINDVQFNELGDKAAKDGLVGDFIKVMQASRFDHRLPTIPRQQVDDMRPVLEKVADDVLSKRFGMKGAIYILGGGVIIPGNPAQSMANYEHVRAVGVEGVAAEQWHKRKAKTPHTPQANDNKPTNKVFDAKLQERQQKGYVAESARKEELIRQRQSIYSRGPGYTGSPDESRPGAALVV